jgi:hypothetical protein
MKNFSWRANTYFMYERIFYSSECCKVGRVHLHAGKPIQGPLQRGQNILFSVVFTPYPLFHEIKLLLPLANAAVFGSYEQYMSSLFS